MYAERPQDRSRGRKLILEIIRSAPNRGRDREYEECSVGQALLIIEINENTQEQDACYRNANSEEVEVQLYERCDRHRLLECGFERKTGRTCSRRFRVTDAEHKNETIASCIEDLCCIGIGTINCFQIRMSEFAAISHINAQFHKKHPRDRLE